MHDQTPCPARDDVSQGGDLDTYQTLIAYQTNRWMSMARVPREGGHRLHWQIGQYDPRCDRSEDRRDRIKILIAMFVVTSLFLGLLSRFLGGDDLRSLLLLFLAIWLLLFIVFFAERVVRMIVRFEVYTIVRLPPEETGERLARALELRVPHVDRRDRRPWLHGEQVVLKVAMDHRESATVIVQLIHQSYEGPTRIVVRSGIRRNDWWDLRGVIEETFHDVGVPGGWELDEGPAEDVTSI